VGRGGEDALREREKEKMEGIKKSTREKNRRSIGRIEGWERGKEGKGAWLSRLMSGGRGGREEE